MRPPLKTMTTYSRLQDKICMYQLSFLFNSAWSYVARSRLSVRGWPVTPRYVHNGPTRTQCTSQSANVFLVPRSLLTRGSYCFAPLSCNLILCLQWDYRCHGFQDGAKMCTDFTALSNS